MSMLDTVFANAHSVPETALPALQKARESVCEALSKFESSISSR
jgi:hypothetical protein